MEAERSTSEATAASAGDAEPPTTQYHPAARAITSPAQLQRFLASSVCDDFVAFVLALNAATRGQANDAVAADVRTSSVQGGISQCRRSTEGHVPTYRIQAAAHACV